MLKTVLISNIDVNFKATIQRDAKTNEGTTPIQRWPPRVYGQTFALFTLYERKKNKIIHRPGKQVYPQWNRDVKGRENNGKIG